MKPFVPFNRKPKEIDWQEGQNPLHSARIAQMLRSYTLTLIIIAIATLLSLAFRNFGFSESNFIIIYNLGVVVIAYFTGGYLYCVVASVLSMLAYNYFFTVPYFTLVAYSPEYPVTFIIMLLSALIAGTLTSSVKRETERAENRENRLRILYSHEKNLLKVNSKPELLKVAAKDIGELFGASVMITAADLSGSLSMRHIDGNDVFQNETDQMAIKEAFQSGLPCGAGNEISLQ
jgi:two-component system sensor histidine kinase KdpD